MYFKGINTIHFFPYINKYLSEHLWGGRAVSRIKAFLRDEGGVVSAEYVIFLAALGIICIVGILALFGGLGSLFSAYATYFQAYPS